MNNPKSRSQVSGAPREVLQQARGRARAADAAGNELRRGSGSGSGGRKQARLLRGAADGQASEDQVISASAAEAHRLCVLLRSEGVRFEFVFGKLSVFGRCFGGLMVSL